MIISPMAYNALSCNRVLSNTAYNAVNCNRVISNMAYNAVNCNRVISITAYNAVNVTGLQILVQWPLQPKTPPFNNSLLFQTSYQYHSYIFNINIPPF